ncbi:MAG: flagellar type III secretion system protein FlhB [Pseudomonadota bacterium]
MADPESDESKPYEPSPKKLEDARKRGDIPRAADLTSAFAYAGFLLALGLAGAMTAGGIGALGTALIGQADRLAPLFLRGPSLAPTGEVLRSAGSALAPLFGVPMLLVLGALIAMRGIVVAPDKLKPKLSRISLISNAKQKFGVSGLVEFAKSFVKLIVYSAALGLFLASRVDELVSATALEPRQSSVLLGRLSVEFLAVIVAIAGVIGALDYIWQHAELRRRNMMSHKELRDETKDMEGDPHLKERRRARGMAIAQNAMLADVPDAAVVIVNPEHYAVALKWAPGDPGAPVCVAKGVDEVAARIREAALEAGVPIHRDPPTARALHATVDLGEEIAEDHYGPVAAAIRFADAMRARARASLL